MSRKKGPALYELISQKPPVLTQPVHQHEVTDDEEHLDHNVLRPGSSVRMSIGTLGVCITVFIACIVVAFTMGYRRGNAIAKADYGNRLLQNLQQPAFTEIKPITENPPSRNERVIDPQVQHFGTIMSDPRVSGRYYYILMQTTKDGALQLGEFCRGEGLETYVVSGHNTRSYRVITLPGFTERNGEASLTLRSQINAIGRQWTKTTASGGSDLHDAYTSLYN